MPETGAAIAEWWEAAGAADAAAGAEAASGAAAAGEAGGALAGEGILGAEAAGAGLEAGLGTGLFEGASGATAADAGAAGSIIEGSGPASTSLAETAPATPTQTAAQNLVEGVPQEVGSGPVADEVPYGVNDATGLQNAAPAEKGLIGGAMDWVNAKPINTLITGQAIGGVAKGAFEERAANRKLKAEQEAREYPAKLKQGNTSVGGGNVNLNLRPGGRILTRPDGTKVFVPGTGIINGAMNGVRG